MPRSCSICLHPDLAAIEQDVVAGVPLRTIVGQREGSGTPLSKSALARHRAEHLSPSLITVVRAAEDERVIGLVDQLRSLLGHAVEILGDSRQQGKGSQALAAIREARALLEVIGRVSGELDDRPTVQVLNVWTDPEIVAMRTRLLAALAPFPEARLAAAAALSADRTPPRELVS